MSTWNDVASRKRGRGRIVWALVIWGTLGLPAGMAGCAPPPNSQVAPADPPPKKAKAPATTPYGQALEATDRLKNQAQEYNERLEKLNDPFAK